jgi:hypothetical protein
MEQQDKIKAYLRGKLSAEEVENFQREMKDDPALTDWVHTTKNLMLLEDLADRETIQGYLAPYQRLSPHAPIPPLVRYRKYIILLSITLFVILLVWYWPKKEKEDQPKSSAPIDTYAFEGDDTSDHQEIVMLKRNEQAKIDTPKKTKTTPIGIDGIRRLLKIEEKRLTASIIIRKPDDGIKIRGSKIFQSSIDSINKGQYNARILELESTTVPAELFLMGLKYFRQDSFSRAVSYFDLFIQSDQIVENIKNSMEAAAYYRALSLLGTGDQAAFVTAIKPIMKDKNHPYNNEATLFYTTLFSEKYKR